MPSRPPLRHAAALLLRWLACLALLPAAHAQLTLGSFYADHDIRTNLERGLLQIQATPGGVAPTFGGSVFGRSLQGYHAAQRGEAVWVEHDGGQPARVYVASIQRRTMAGVVYSLARAHGATPERNAFAFATQVRGGVTVHNPPPLAEPSTAGPVFVPEQWALWMRANASEGALVLRIDPASGDLAGLVFGDPIRGHYAANGGTIAFVRLRAGVPVQFFEGRFTLGVPSQPTLAGSFHALDEAGGASPQQIRFDMAARGGAAFEAFGVGPGCIGVPHAQLMAAGAPIRLEGCGTPRTAFARVRTLAASTVLVARESGMCLDVPGASQQDRVTLQQFPCHGGGNQSVLLHRVAGSTAHWLQMEHSGQCLERAAWGDIQQRRNCNVATLDNTFRLLPPP